MASVIVNDDSCPQCDVGFRGPCPVAQSPNVVMNLPPGCIELVWPYFQAVWSFEAKPTDQVFRIEAFSGPQRIAMKDLGVP